MSNYGTPDFFRPPSPGGQIIAGSKGYTAGTITFFPQDVSAFTTVGVRLVPTGVITGYQIVVDFYADQAATELVDEYAWHSYQGAAIMDAINPPAPWMKAVVTPFATGGGQTLDIWLIGFGGGGMTQHSRNDGVLLVDSQSVAAGQQSGLYLNTVRAGAVNVVLETTGASWYAELNQMYSYGGVGGWALRADQGSHGKRINQQVVLGRDTARFLYVNNEGVAHTVTRGIISA